MIKSFIKYSSAGGLATAVHYLIFLLAIHLMLWAPWQSTHLAGCIGALTSYSLNYRYTFLSQAAHRKILPKFLLVAGVGIIIQTLIVAALSPHLHYLLAQLVATFSGLILTFIFNRYWTFA